MSIVEEYAELLEEAKADEHAWLTMPSEVPVEFGEGWEEIERTFYDESRWYNTYRVIFKKDDEYLAVFDRQGATENQDSMTITDDTPEYHQVKPVEVTKVEYRKV